MANLIEQAKSQIDALLQAACEKAVAAGEFPAEAVLKGTVEIPKDVRNGDYAANHAMAGAKALRMPPRKIAETLVKHLALEGSFFSAAEIAEELRSLSIETMTPIEAMNKLFELKKKVEN